MLPEENQNIALSDRKRLLEQAFYAILLMSDEQVNELLERWEKLDAEHSNCVKLDEDLSNG